MIKQDHETQNKNHPGTRSVHHALHYAQAYGAAHNCRNKADPQSGKTNRQLYAANYIVRN